MSPFEKIGYASKGKDLSVNPDPIRPPVTGASQYGTTNFSGKTARQTGINVK